MLRVIYGGVVFLFMGDAAFAAEQDMISSCIDLKCDVLKVGHHGSSYASSTAFLSRAKPSTSVIMVGAGNSYGHPSPETLERLSSAGSIIYRTDKNGDVTIIANGSNYTVEPSNTSAIIIPDESNVSKALYIGNSNTKKFHLSTCRYVSSISPDHIVYFSSREEAIDQGYAPCKVCNP